jgi:hypothetical protein
VLITTLALLVGGAGLALAGGAGGEPAPTLDAQISTHRVLETPPSAVASPTPVAEPDPLIVAVPLGEESARAEPKVLRQRTVPPAEKTEKDQKRKKEEKTERDKRDDDHETVKPDVRDEDDSDHDDDDKD